MIDRPATCALFATTFVAACGSPEPQPIAAFLERARFQRSGCGTEIGYLFKQPGGTGSGRSVGDFHLTSEKVPGMLLFRQSKTDDRIELVTGRGESNGATETLHVPLVGPPAAREQDEQVELYALPAYYRSTEKDWPEAPVSRTESPPAMTAGASQIACDGGVNVRSVERSSETAGAFTFRTCPWPETVTASGAEVVSNEDGVVTLRVAAADRTLALTVPLRLTNRAGTTECELRLVPEQPAAAR